MNKMIDKRLPKTNEAVDFLQSFGKIKRIIAVAEIVKMFNGEYTKEHNPFFDSTGQVNKNVTQLEIIKMGFYPKMLKWKRFMLDISRMNFKQMSDEFCAWIKFDQEEEGEKIIKQLEEQIFNFSTNLTYHNVLATISGYNDGLSKSKIKNKEELKLDLDIEDYVQVIENMLEEINERMEFIKERYKEQENELANSPRRRGVPVSHLLRWNNTKTPFEKFFNELINKNLILTGSNEKNTEEIMHILNTVFEVIDIPKPEMGDVFGKQFLPVERKKFYVPQRLKWKDSGKGTAFAKKFGPLIENHTIFIDEYNQAEERKFISVIFLQIFDIANQGKSDVISDTTLTSYFKRFRF